MTEHRLLEEKGEEPYMASVMLVSELGFMYTKNSYKLDMPQGS